MKMQFGLLFKSNLTSLIFLFACILIIPIYNITFFNVQSISGVKSCPFCLDESICSCLNNDRFVLDLSRLGTNFININKYNEGKQVFFGKCDEKPVVLKKVTSNIKLNNKSEKMPDGTKFNSFKKIVEELKLFISYNNGGSVNNLNFCPSNDRLEVLLTPLNKSSSNLTHLYFNLQYMIQVNMEPLIQQIIKDWGVAPYLGGCGFIAVSEYCGDSLTSIAPKMTWNERALVATQLIQFAFNATFDNPDFAFYFTDMSADNFAVSSTNCVRLVDLEKVIVVDKLAQGDPQDWNIRHQVYHDDARDEFAFSVEEICSHKISDLNIYSICQGILSETSDLITGGLLYSAPQDIQGLIRECISPKNGASRFETAQMLMNTLNV